MRMPNSRLKRFFYFQLHGLSDYKKDAKRKHGKKENQVNLKVNGSVLL